MNNIFNLGIDIGSTTVKIALIDDNNKIYFSDYKRHFADIQNTLVNILIDARKSVDFSNKLISIRITGSGGLSLSKALNVEFIQEVVAVSKALKFYAPQTDVAIELGGEDAKIIYFDGDSVDQRMNGICAGGTGSFIDQMASLLKTDATGLNEYAKNYKSIYPIAARCGVFAKSDIQPLINEGATKEDLSVSIFNAVVNQTISGLACGKPIRGHVAFLGGPLHFLPELRNCFIRTLKLNDETAIIPENSHLFAALGSSMTKSSLNTNKKYTEYSIDELIDKLQKGIKLDSEIKRLDPLFNNEEEYNEFVERHKEAAVIKKDIKDYEGDCFLGIDAGSTTTKIALISKQGELLYSFYKNNSGSTIDTAKESIKELSKILPKNTNIVSSCSTGYGEALLKSAFKLEYGVVETIAHYYAGAFFNPDVDCILDIGGQDMKCIKIKNGYVDNIMLNEACSSGCGSFIENFANSLGHPVSEFAKMALFAKNPVDLGTRCTVFMNSNVKQAQKEGASANDISAGLSYSVIKNALYKVIKLSDPKDLGECIVVQGGTFYNESVLRALEKILNTNVIRPDISGIMGAFGAALYAKEKYYRNKDKQDTKAPLDLDYIINLKYQTKMARCGGCSNNCALTINTFTDGSKFVSGNRCEKFFWNGTKTKPAPNLFEYKLKRTFDYEPLQKEKAKYGLIGIPRVLNMYENFPFWAIFFRELGYRVVLSPNSTRAIYELGIESIPSESECYPAKIVHGHVEWLINQGVDFIFMPCIPYERNETPDAQNHYNCPMVTSYAENIKNNLENLHEKNIKFYNPFLAFTNEKILTDSLISALDNKKYFPYDIDPLKIKVAAHLAWEELIRARNDISKEGEKVLSWIKENNAHGIVLAGRPYHVDPEINHGIPEFIASCNIAVLTEDSISHLGVLERPIIVTDQWMYHTRLYKAAQVVKQREDLDLIQLNSFGCGLDAVTSDQVNDLLTKSGKIYTLLKIDEVNNIGAARIRIRSLLSAIENKSVDPSRNIETSKYTRTLFTKSMSSKYKILAPQMSPIHFDLVAPAVSSCGYDFEVLDNSNEHIIDVGLKYVNNDACYPSIIVVGQIMDALLSGKYDINKVAVMITQTGGGCRASNYISFIRRALEKAGLSQVPVISLNTNGMEKNPGFKFSIPIVMKAMQAVVYGDLFMRLVYATRPLEKNKGETDALHEKWKKICISSLTKAKVSMLHFNKNVRTMIKEFDNIERLDINKPKVGVVGEILVKFSPLANNNIVELLESEGAICYMPDLMDFLLYSFYNSNFRRKYLGGSLKTKIYSNLAIFFIEYLRNSARSELKKSKHFSTQADIKNLASMAKQYISLGNQTGEGWFLTGEMLELIDTGVPNIICTQPFGCLPNHIVGKGVIKEIKKQHKEANIVAIDYDPSASKVNQLNRIKLLLSNAKY